MINNNINLKIKFLKLKNFYTNIIKKKDKRNNNS